MRRSSQDYIRPTRLTPQEVEVLRLVAERPMTVEQVQEALGVSRSPVLQIIGRLERPHVLLSRYPRHR